MNDSDCLAYLARLGQEVRGAKFDLETIRRLTQALGDPQKQYSTMIVAGTNGKGSTSAMLASILERAGFRTGLYTSPHLVRVNERIRVNGREISDDDFAAACAEVRQVVERLAVDKVLVHRPSFFEFVTALAFLHFERVGVDFAVLEVGMGGRLDATNVAEPRVSVITNVELDHMEYLGYTHAAIAGEKAGVIRAGRPVVSGCEHPDAVNVIRQRSAALGARLLETPALAGLGMIRDHRGRYAFEVPINGHRFLSPVLPLAGKFQVKNALAAMTAAGQLAEEGFNIPERAIIEGLERARWPGRLEVVAERPLVLLDGAHNPAAAREIAQFIREELGDRRVRLVYASMRDKPVGDISELLFPLAERVYVTRAPSARAASPEEIADAACGHAAELRLEPDPVRAVERACREARPEDVVLVAGSLFLVGAIKAAGFTGG